MGMRLSETQHQVLSEIDWHGPDATFLRKSSYVKTLESLVKRGLVTTELADEDRIWKCNITDKGLYTLRTGLLEP
jgi:DNA-binding MarR family transcriptional regulator